jgi:hypothetical protein
MGLFRASANWCWEITATIHGKMKRESDGAMLCFAEHNKAAADLNVQRSKVKL